MARTAKTRSAEDAVLATLRRASVALVARLLKIGHPAVADFTTAGMPRNDDGSYDFEACVDWLKSKKRWLFREGAARTVPVGSAEDYDTAIKRLKAAAAQRDHDLAMGKLIERTDAVAAQTRLALEFKASLLGLPEQMSNALSNLPAREVERRLRERVNAMLTRSQDGMVPISAKMVAAIEKLVADYADAAA